MPNASDAAQAARDAVVKRPLHEADHSGAYFDSPVNGDQIYYKVWSPPPGTTPKAVVLWFHGLGSHCMYEKVMIERFVDSGFVVKSMDYRGHGWTLRKNKNGKMGHHGSFKAIFTDMNHLLLTKKGDTEVPDLPVFVVGESLGGLIATAYVHTQPIKRFKGLIATCPAYKAGKLPAWYLRMAAYVLGDVWPTFSPPLKPVDDAGICTDENRVLAFIADPLSHNAICAKLGKDIMVYGKRILKAAPQFNHPILVAHGLADQITSPAASKQFVENCSSADKEFLGLGDGVLHALFGEPAVKDMLLAKYIAWITERAQ
ncbi:hypothetical protein HDU77_005863 [Chytriomyces hyalinus]|nr:hypothetical protein HDU77_005863 [Chytriomyces hyalinus]